MLTFLIKLILSPLLIGAVSLAGRRWGPAVGGWLVGLPLTSGPVLLFLALDQGTAFAAVSAQAIMLGLNTVAIFCLCYSWLARRWPWLPTLLASWLVVITAAFALGQIRLDALPTFILIVAMLIIVLRLMPPDEGVSTSALSPTWELPLRMLIASAFVLTLTGLAQVLGPHLSGLLSPLPVFGSILAPFTHRFQSAAVTRNLLRGVLLGSFSFAAFFLVVALFIQSLGLLPTYLLAALVALSLHSVSLWLIRRGVRPISLAAPAL